MATDRREGSLEAPTRHPLGHEKPEFWDEPALLTELERVYDICHGCRRCVSLCGPFPILFDGDRTVSKGLGLFTEEWGGSKIDQNMPTVYIIDNKGHVQFKYISQNTFDRPGFDYLMKFLDRMIDDK